MAESLADLNTQLTELNTAISSALKALEVRDGNYQRTSQTLSQLNAYKKDLLKRIARAERSGGIRVRSVVPL